jgi:tight adherence protein B
MTLVAVCALVVAMGLLGPVRAEGRLHALDHEARGKTRWVHLAAGLLVVLTVMGGLMVLAPAYIAWTLIAAMLVATLVWELRMHAVEKRALARAAEVAQACRVIAAQLRIGQTPATALAVSAEESKVLADCAAAQQIGADVPATLVRAGAVRGCGGLAQLGRAWQLCERSGSPLAPAASRVSATVDADTRLRADIAAELVVPRLTGRLLTALPLLGIGMGYFAGGDPVTFLTTTLIGKACLTGAVFLACAGLVWTEVLALRAQGNQ